MAYRILGSTGVLVSSLCLGTANFGDPTSETEGIRMVHKALDAGINFIDTANYYNGGASEEIVGRSLAGEKREWTILATKFYYPVDPDSTDPNNRGNSRRHIMQAAEASLRRLGTDWIDLYQIHRPDFGIPQEETLRALDDLIRQGKVRYIGSSTFPAWFVMEGLATSEKYNLARFVSEQPPYNLLDRRIENELVPLALKYRLSLLPWSPLAMGLLAGRYGQAHDFPPDSRAGRIGSIYANRITSEAINKGNQILVIAEKAGVTAAQLAYLWAKEQPGITAPIIGPKNEAQLDEALVILNMELDERISKELDHAYPPGTAAANFHNTSGWMK